MISSGGATTVDASLVGISGAIEVTDAGVVGPAAVALTIAVVQTRSTVDTLGA